MTTTPPLIDLRRGELSFDVIAPLLGDRLEGTLKSLLRCGFNYSDAAGSRALRGAFVERLARIATRPEDTLITHGALSAIDLAFRAYQPRRFVAFDPTYREALAIASSYRVPIVSLPRPSAANDAAKLAAILRPHDLVYVVPTLNNPDGLSLDHYASATIGAAIAMSGAALVEDDAYGLLASSPPPPSVAAMALQMNPASPVMRLQSFSKIICPGARCCVVEGAPHAMARLADVKLDFGTAPLAAEFIAKILIDRFEQFRNDVADELRARCKLAVAKLGGWPALLEPDGGYFLWLPWTNDDAVDVPGEIARKTGVLIADGRPFEIRAVEKVRYLRLSVAWASRADLATGCEALRQYPFGAPDTRAHKP